MAKKEQGGMQNFVKSKNPDSAGPSNGPDDKPNFEDLKVQPPKTSTAAKSHQLRSKSQTANQSAAARVDSRAQNAQQSGRRNSTGQRRFYDTDASSVGATSTATSAEGSHNSAREALQQRQARDEQQDEQKRPSSSAGYETGSEEEDEELLPNPLQNRPPELNERQWNLVKALEAQKGNRPDGRDLPHVSGDTYPSTTSGRPSEPDVDRRNENRSMNQPHKPQAALQTTLPQRESSHRQPLGTIATQHYLQASEPAGAARANQGCPATGLLARQDSAEKTSVEQQVASGFSFAKAARQQPNMRPPQPSQPQNAGGPVGSKTPAASNIAQPASVPPAKEIATHLPLQQQTTDVAKQNAVAGLREPKPEKKGHRSPQFQQRDMETAPDYEPFSDGEADMQNGIASHAPKQSQTKEPEVHLDYEVPELFNMDYQELKQQSFDTDPNANDFNLPADQQNDSIETKLDTVSALQPEDKSRFFASLSLDEWEQAGEWFLGRFSNVVGKLKEARQEKRQAARLFEDEIQSRFKAVGKKRKQIEESFSEMKESGGKVLQGTPKKTRTK